MNSAVETEDWNELIQMLRQAEKGVCSPAAAGANGSSEGFKASKQALQSFHTTAAMLGLPELERAGIELERYVIREVEPSANVEAVAVLGFALNALVEEMRGQEGSKAPRVEIKETMEILGVDCSVETSGELTEDDLPPDSPDPSDLQGEPAQAKVVEVLVQPAPDARAVGGGADLSRLEQVAAQLGGQGLYPGIHSQLHSKPIPLRLSKSRCSCPPAFRGQTLLPSSPGRATGLRRSSQR